jgi:magnesium transporter
VTRVEARLGGSLGNREVLELLRYQRALVFFDTALRSNLVMLERLGRDRRLGEPDADAEILDDVLVEVRQAQQATDIASQILSQTMDAFASIVSNNLNVVMKILTALTIVLAVPTMVASFYGMNVRLPLQQHPWAFAAAIAVSVALALATAGYFWKKRWL